jgi:hypothetical protein
MRGPGRGGIPVAMNHSPRKILPAALVAALAAGAVPASAGDTKPVDRAFVSEVMAAAYEAPDHQTSFRPRGRTHVVKIGAHTSIDAVIGRKRGADVGEAVWFFARQGRHQRWIGLDSRYEKITIESVEAVDHGFRVRYEAADPAQATFKLVERHGRLAMRKVSGRIALMPGNPREIVQPR